MSGPVGHWARDEFEYSFIYFSFPGLCRSDGFGQQHSFEGHDLYSAVCFRLRAYAVEGIVVCGFVPRRRPLVGGESISAAESNICSAYWLVLLAFSGLHIAIHYVVGLFFGLNDAGVVCRGRRSADEHIAQQQGDCRAPAETGKDVNLFVVLLFFTPLHALSHACAASERVCLVFETTVSHIFPWIRRLSDYNRRMSSY